MEMTYVKLSADEVGKKTNGTSLSGYLPKVTYSQLVEIFGEPTLGEPSGDNKVQKEWVFEDEDRDIFTVYDYKTYDENYTMYENTDWHVGSKVPVGEFIAWVERNLNI
jgi:hypothetical protein